MLPGTKDCGHTVKSAARTKAAGANTHPSFSFKGEPEECLNWSPSFKKRKKEKETTYKCINRFSGDQYNPDSITTQNLAAEISFVPSFGKPTP